MLRTLPWRNGRGSFTLIALSGVKRISSIEEELEFPFYTAIGGRTHDMEFFIKKLGLIFSEERIHGRFFLHKTIRKLPVYRGIKAVVDNPEYAGISIAYAGGKKDFYRETCSAHLRMDSADSEYADSEIDIRVFENKEGKYHLFDVSGLML